MSETVTLVSPDPFVIDLGTDTIVDLGDPVHILPEANYEVESYTWEPDSIINCVGECLALEWPPPHSMYIQATGTSTKNCLANDSVFVTVNEVRRAWFPNAFSPNGDGLNDYFTVFGSIPNVKRVDKMIVFDRWGKKIYEAYDFVPNEPTSGWDGRAEGKPQPPGVYVYVMFIRFLDDEVIRYSGSFTLVR
jgi:gliding motility-associated-like protein